MDTPEVIKNGKEILMKLGKVGGYVWVKLSLEGDIDGIKAGDTFISGGVTEKIVGFTDKEYESSPPFDLIWTMTSRGEFGWWNKATMEKICKREAIIKAEKPMTAETAEEEIRRFLNFFNS